jgi:hypothetical protein
MNFKHQKIFYMDFDTIFSSYIQNNTLKYDLNTFSNLKIVLPQIENIEALFKDALNSLSCTSILILDSLNGLIDLLNMLNLSKLKNKNKNNNTEAATATDNKKFPRYKSGGYQSLNILFLLLKKIENNEIPIIVTAYQPIERSKNMIFEFLSNKDSQTNHFIRISNLVLFLEFIEKDNKTGFTLIKKNLSNSITVSFDKNSGVFYPYSKWYCYNFFKI